MTTKTDALDELRRAHHTVPGFPSKPHAIRLYAEDLGKMANAHGLCKVLAASTLPVRLHSQPRPKRGYPDPYKNLGNELPW